MAGTLFLLPVPLAPGDPSQMLPEPVLRIARSLQYVLAENARSARAFLKAAGHPGPMQQVRIVQIGKDPSPAQADAWLEPLCRGESDAALVSECGCPGIADPGAAVVARAHAKGLSVRPLVGPSSLWLALMASGMNGQRFRFLGYLPHEGRALSERLHQAERDAAQGETQIFIETPYRTERLFGSILDVCAPGTRLCLAVDLGTPDQAIASMSIARWRGLAPAQRPSLKRRPAVFLLYADPGSPSGRALPGTSPSASRPSGHAPSGRQ
jgi:16S rRNA (cytidine1402-2'-O)-methyltransferase